jgi:subtilase family serine protease
MDVNGTRKSGQFFSSCRLTVDINSASICGVNQNGNLKFQRLFFVISLSLALFFSSDASAQTAPRKFLRGHVPAAVARLQAKGVLAATNRLHLAIGLPLRNESALDDLLGQLYDPASPNYRKYLTPEQFTEQFGPTESDYQKVITFARANGLTVTSTYGNRVLLDVSGTADNIQKAFQVTLRVYQHPREPRIFFAPDVEPSVETNLPILDISGLNNFELPHPKNLKFTPAIAQANATPRSGSGSGGTYIGNDFRAAYVPGISLDGTGQTVGLLEFDGYYSGDITSYESQAGLANIPLQNVPVSGGVSTPGSGNIEVALDIEMAISMAPNLSAVVIFEAPNTGTFNSLLNTMVSSNQIKQLSCSWGGGGPNASSENIFKNMAAQGQSFFNASGDSDAFVGSVPFPSESTNITQVGGTTLSTTGPGGSYVSETVWNWGLDQGSYVGTSGGISTTYAIPTWQQGISMAANQGSTTMRNIPDVALTADNVFVVANNGVNESVGGTSCAAPLWAGLIALANQQATTNGQSPVGFINPAIYEIGRESAFAADFHDITTGNNAWPSSPANFFAAVGYDLCTGWGTPNGLNLINALLKPDPFVISPVSGFNFSGPFGGPFGVNSQNLLLTNGSATSLTWSVSSMPSWLNISSGGGTLNPGGSSPVTVSLNSTSGTLTGGTYTGYLWLTNVTSGIGHSRLFTLQVNDPLAIIPTNGFAASGPVGGPFNVTSQNFVLTNLGAGSISWSLTGLPSWLTATTSSGTFSSFGSTTVTVNLNSNSTILPAGIYIANLILADTTTGSAQNLPVTLSVGQPLVQNPGFETGDFTGWTLIGDGGNVNFVDNGVYITPHSGSYAAALGEVGTTLATLSQTLPTSVGQTYLLSLWLDSPNVSPSTPNKFTVAWNGVTLFNKSNIGRIGWTNLQFTVKSTASSTVLQFGSRDDNYYLGLDDVTVTPLFPPSFIVQPTNVTVSAGSNAAFVTTAGGTSPLAYQWRKNNINLFNSGNISGATTYALTISSAATNNNGNYSLVVTNAYGSVTSSVVVLTVNSLAANIALTSSENQSGYHDSIKFTAAVTPTNATGTVQFFTNSFAFDTEVLLAAQATSINVGVLPRGTNFITAIYSGDANDLPATNTLAQIVTNHPPSAAAAFYTATAGFPLNISVADLATNWSDIDGDTISLVAASVSTNGVNVTNNAATLVYLNTNIVADQFVCTIRDSFGGTNFQTVNINVLPPPDPTPNITGVSGNPDGSFTLNLAGASGYTYILETTTDLFSSVIWQPIATNTLGTNGVWQFNDTSATNFAQRFYRLMLAP